MEIKYSDIKRMNTERIGFFWWVAFLFPKALFTVETIDGTQHRFILYDDASPLVKALTTRGISEKFV